MVRTPHCRRHAAGRRAVARARHAHRDAWFRSHDLAGNRNLVVNVACSDIVVVTPAATAPAPAPAALERKHPVDARQQVCPQLSRRVSCRQGAKIRAHCLWPGYLAPRPRLPASLRHHLRAPR